MPGRNWVATNNHTLRHPVTLVPERQLGQRYLCENSWRHWCPQLSTGPALWVLGQSAASRGRKCRRNQATCLPPRPPTLFVQGTARFLLWTKPTHSRWIIKPSTAQSLHLGDWRIWLCETHRSPAGSVHSGLWGPPNLCHPAKGEG